MTVSFKKCVLGLIGSCLLFLPTVRLAGQDVSIRNNLLYDATGTPNLGLEFQLGDHFSLGVNGGFKSWPRFLFWDTDNVENTSHWRHFLVAPEARFYFDEIFKGLFTGVDLLYTHYNVGNVKFPLGIYPEVRDHRLQGDFFGAGLFVGYAWRMGPHWRIEALAGMHVGYVKADKFECDHCGARVGTKEGVALVPKLGLNVAYNFKRREQKKKEILEIIAPPEPQPAPIPVAVPEFPELSIPRVEEWKGVAGQLAVHHPVLRQSSEYIPYTPDRILRKEEGALYVFYELGKSQLKRSFTEKNVSRDNGPVLDEIVDITASILKDTTSSVSCIQVIGLASIEGAEANNERLAMARAQSLKTYMKERLPLNDNLFEIVSGGEAWTEFRDQVNDYLLAGGGAELTSAQLQEVLDIIDNEADVNRRERKLKALEGGTVFAKLKKHVLADQRNSGYIRVYFDYVPDENALAINRAVDALEAGEPGRALEILDAVKDDARGRMARVSALLQLGREEEGVALLQEAASADDSGAATALAKWDEFVRARAEYQQYLKELEEYNKSISINQ